ncbi:hypothetical protein HELRODRAFT_190749 [Helobdella robusta]|uniref:UspA domain-containing protein n=1 Tax=Helobdella robusta TaxID=6412 RepID=T1FS94_HELRO|nr:hypothetical protein HELRODRAFT_190749 [Helobdella robusta]ESO08486.1 hypothetical protein HELRODRAFT_190749 [Helobdella robusta]
MEQNIVIAIDYTNQAENAVKYYLEKIHRPGNKLILVHCVELPELSLNKARDSHMSPGVLANMWKEEEANMKALEDKMATLLKEKKVPGVLRTVSGRPGEVICQVAHEEKAVMIITGTKGIGKMRRTILGSVSDYLVGHALCPVMVCKEESERKTRMSISASSDNSSKLRHVSGESITSFTTSLRQRFASGGKSRSHSASTDKDDAAAKMGADKKENKDPSTSRNT